MNKLGKKVSILLGLFFAGYWGYTLLSVISLDRDAAFRRRVYEYSNFVPALCVIIILLLIYKFAGQKKSGVIPEIGKKQFYIILIVVSAVAFGVQLYLMQYLGRAYRYDFGTIRRAVLSLVNDHVLYKPEYFNYYRMNRNIFYIFTRIVAVFKDWQPVIVIGIILINLSVLMAAQMCYKLTDNKGITLFIFLIGIFLYDFSIRTYMPYTDNYGAFFLIAFLFVLVNRRTNMIWMILGTISLSIGCYIKFTGGILLIAGLIVLAGLKVQEKKVFFKKLGILALVFMCVFGGITKAQNSYLAKNGFVDDPECQRGFWHFFMMGQNDQHLGTYNKRDLKFSDGFATKKERDAANKAEGIKRIKDRGIRGNLFFYTYKNYQNYDDGCFAPVTGIYSGEEQFGDSWVENLYLEGRENNRYYAMVQQILWLMLLGAIMFIGIRVKSDNMFMLYIKIIILGVSAYTLLFEGRAKYLFMFVPIYLVAAGMGLNEMITIKNKLKKDI